MSKKSVTGTTFTANEIASKVVDKYDIHELMDVDPVLKYVITHETLTQDCDFKFGTSVKYIFTDTIDDFMTIIGEIMAECEGGEFTTFELDSENNSVNVEINYVDQGDKAEYGYQHTITIDNLDKKKAKRLAKILTTRYCTEMN